MFKAIVSPFPPLPTHDLGMCVTTLVLLVLDSLLELWDCSC